MKLRVHRIRWSALVAIVVAAAAGAQAYDDDHVQAHLQPFLGAYAGMYQQNTDDLNNILRSKKNDFLPFVPNGGITLGAAYDRFHAGFGVGYQMINSNDLSTTDRVKNASYLPNISFGKNATCTDTSKACYYYDGKTTQVNAFKDFSYDMIPIEAFGEMTLFKNAAAINFLLGGSAGVGLVSLTQPISAFMYKVDDTVKTFNGTGGTNGADKEALFLYSAYAGLRINIAERLNLQGQIGWRGAFTDKIYFSDCDCYQYATTVENVVVDPATGGIKGLGYANQRQYRLDLSGAFVRADLRWTFASQADKDIDRATTRRNDLQGGRVSAGLRGR